MFATDISNMKRALENQERKDQNPVEGEGIKMVA